MGLLLLYWLKFCPFGIVLPGFSCKFPTWRLPDKGHVCELVTDSVVGDRVLGGDGICRVLFPRSADRAGVSCESRLLGGLKEFDSTEKHQHTLQDFVIW